MEYENGINVIEVPVQGSCVTRNGILCEISKIMACQTGDSVQLNFVSKHLKRTLHAGADIRTEDFDAFCLAWVKKRGLVPHALKGGDVQVESDQIKKTESIALFFRSLLIGAPKCIH